jgi:hypothetical protein
MTGTGEAAALTETKVRECGECSLCCKILPITMRTGQGDADFPFDKPEGEWCRHCAPGHGCKIWKDGLPNLCRTYQCLWRANTSLPDDFRPDKIGAIFTNKVLARKHFRGELLFNIVLADKVLHPAVEAFISRPDVSAIIRHKNDLELILNGVRRTGLKQTEAGDVVTTRETQLRRSS